MRQRDGVISKAIYYDVIRTSLASTYKADAVIIMIGTTLNISTFIQCLALTGKARNIT